MAENKVVIKINYDKDKNHRPVAEPKMVTVWHTQRIIAAVAILALLVGIPIFWLSGDSASGTDELRQAETAEKEQPLNNDAVIEAAGLEANVNKGIKQAPEIVKQNTKKSEPSKAESKRPAAIIYNKRVIRASLNSGPKDKEPYEPVRLPVRLAQNQSIEIFYFNELRNISDTTLFHYWFKDGRMVDKKPLTIKDSKEKVLSAKTLSYKDKGEWQIQLVNKAGKVLSEVNFFVNPE